MRISHRRFRVRDWCAIAAACVMLGLGAGAQQPDPAAAKLTTVLADLAQSTEAQSAGTARKLSVEALPKSAQDAIRTRRLRIDDNNAVQVYVLVDQVTDDVKSQLVASGATIEIADAARRRIQARIPVTKLLAVARLPVVGAIRLPTYARHRTGSVTTEGDAILQAAAARADWNVDGTGVRVGVISDGLKGVFATGCTSCAALAGGAMDKGDLPTATGTRNSSGVLVSSSGGIVGRSFQSNGDLEGLPPATPVCAFQGAGAEGTALLEIVHDLAPSAKLAFANGDTDLEFSQAVSFLAASNDVVVDDIGFLGEPYDGTSGVSTNTAAALNNPANPIRAYVTAAGNDADEHYLGTYTDSGIDGTTIPGITNPGHLHLFQASAGTTDVLGLGSQPYNLISLPQNGEVAIFLTWNDPFGASSNNYDLYLVQQSTGRVVAHSTDAQSGRADPVEVIDYVNPGAQDRFRIVVQNVQNAAAPRTLNIFSFEPECAATGPQVLAPPRHERHNYNTATQSISAQADAAGSPVGVIAAGAICSASASAASQFPANTPDESCLDTSNSTVEFYSSRGPTLDGRTKPDVSGIDGVSVTGSGGFGAPFFGTSAAAPHIAGIAALYLQAAPCLLNRAASTVDPVTARTLVHDTILHAATPLGRAASDPSNDTFGAGRADAHAAIQTTFATLPAQTTLTVDGTTLFGATLSPAQLGFADPIGCPLTTLSWTGDCGSGPAAQMTCAVGTNNVAVRASNNGVAFSSEADLRIVVTSFAMAASPSSVTVAAGQSARFVVTVTPQNGPFNTPITLACSNLPAQASCSFDPPTLTPGSGVSQSLLTISSTPVTPSSRKGASAGPGMFAAFGGGDSGLLRSSSISGARADVVIVVVLLGLLVIQRRAGGRVWPVGAAAACLAAVATVSASMASGIAVFPASLTFGSQAVGTVAPAALVSLTNIGADPLTLNGISVSGDFAITTTCGTSLAAGASCGVGVTFTPTATGSRTGALTINDNAAGSPHTIALSGTGGAAASGTGPTPSGSYNITITATAGTFVQSGTVVLNVQ